MKKDKKQMVWTEFDCPECSAHNPYEDGFIWGDELFCAWCGAVFLVKKKGDADDARFKLEVQ